jgi:hypothetical protein
MLVTWLMNHHYGIMQSRKKWKEIMLYKEKEETFVFYVKKMQVIGHLFTLTQLWLKVAKIIHEKPTLVKNGILGWGWLKWFRRYNLSIIKGCPRLGGWMCKSYLPNKCKVVLHECNISVYCTQVLAYKNL